MHKLSRLLSAGAAVLVLLVGVTVQTAALAATKPICDPAAKDGSPTSVTADAACNDNAGSQGDVGPGNTAVNPQKIGSCFYLTESQARTMGYTPPGSAPRDKAWVLIWTCSINGLTFSGPFNWLLVVTAPDGAPVNPRQLALEAEKELQLPAVDVGTAPIPAGNAGRVGIVGVPEWFWIQPAGYGQQQKTAAVPGLSVTVIATPGPLQITLGDGQHMTCQGPGTPYDASSAATQSSDCTHIYQQPSVGQPSNVYQVTVSVTWTVTWTVTGAPGGGALPALRTTSPLVPLTIDSAQADNTPAG